MTAIGPAQSRPSSHSSIDGRAIGTRSRCSRWLDARASLKRPTPTAEVQDAGRRPWLSLVAGLVAVPVAALMVIGAFVSGVPFRSFREGMSLSLHPFYAVGVGVVGLVVGVCLLAPKTRLLIGPGAALGAAAASIWGLVYFGGDFFRAYDGSRRSLPELVGHLAFLAVAVLAGIHALRRGLAGVSFIRPHWLRAATISESWSRLSGLGDWTVRALFEAGIHAWRRGRLATGLDCDGVVRLGHSRQCRCDER